MQKGWLMLVLFVNIIGFGWGWHIHQSITYESLLNVAGKACALLVAEYANDPDFHRFLCPFGPCRSDIYGHRISEFMLTHEINRYSGQRGAEHGAAFWAEEAKSAYRRKDPKWTQYLGWATHYLADALCPPHTCLEVNEKGERVTCDFWAQRDGLFSRELRFEMMGLGPFIDALLNPGFDVSFQNDTDILNWIVRKAREITEMPLVPEFPYLKDLIVIFSWISAGIQGLYNYVTG